MKNILIAAVTVFFMSGCAKHTIDEPMTEKIDNKNKMTLGIIQKDIKKGMQKSDVLLVLGSPNLVSSSEDTETWVYDKISTETSSSKSDVSGGVGGIGSGFGAFVSASSTNNNSSVAQNTLTVVLIFNNNNTLEKIAYHTSRF